MKILLILLFIFVNTSVLNANILEINTEKIEYIKKRFGKTAVKRALYLDNYFKKNKHLYNPKSLKAVEKINKFYNRLVYLKDAHHWREDNYWASLLEFISTGAGDSEDFAMAKLYSLIHLGFDAKKFTLVKIKKEYIRSKKVGDEHIVLLYKHSKNSKYIILDSINKKLKIAKNMNKFEKVDKSAFFIKSKLNSMVRAN